MTRKSLDNLITVYTQIAIFILMILLSYIIFNFFDAKSKGLLKVMLNASSIVDKSYKALTNDGSYDEKLVKDLIANYSELDNLSAYVDNKQIFKVEDNAKYNPIIKKFKEIGQETVEQSLVNDNGSIVKVIFTAQLLQSNYMVKPVKIVILFVFLLLIATVILLILEYKVGAKTIKLDDDDDDDDLDDLSDLNSLSDDKNWQNIDDSLDLSEEELNIDNPKAKNKKSYKVPTIVLPEEASNPEFNEEDEIPLYLRAINEVEAEKKESTRLSNPKLELPDEELELPDDISLPEGVKVLELPDADEELELPYDIISLPEGVKALELPDELDILPDGDEALVLPDELDILPDGDEALALPDDLDVLPDGGEALELPADLDDSLQDIVNNIDDIDPEDERLLDEPTDLEVSDMYDMSDVNVEGDLDNMISNSKIEDMYDMTSDVAIEGSIDDILSHPIDDDSDDVASNETNSENEAEINQENINYLIGSDEIEVDDINDNDEEIPSIPNVASDDDLEDESSLQNENGLIDESGLIDETNETIEDDISELDNPSLELIEEDLDDAKFDVDEDDLKIIDSLPDDDDDKDLPENYKLPNNASDLLEKDEAEATTLEPIDFKIEDKKALALFLNSLINEQKLNASNISVAVLSGINDNLANKLNSYAEEYGFYADKIADQLVVAMPFSSKNDSLEALLKMARELDDENIKVGFTYSANRTMKVALLIQESLAAYNESRVSGQNIVSFDVEIDNYKNEFNL